MLERVWLVRVIGLLPLRRWILIGWTKRRVRKLVDMSGGMWNCIKMPIVWDVVGVRCRVRNIVKMGVLIIDLGGANLRHNKNDGQREPTDFDFFHCELPVK